MKLIAHRGASGYAPENTLAAFRLARIMGMESFEFDVHMTRDGVLVVHHDYDLTRTAGIKKSIRSLDYRELSRINVTGGGAGGFTFQRVPRLDEVLDDIEGCSGLVNFELKNDGNAYPGIEEKVLAEALAVKSRTGPALFSSFDFPTLKRMRMLDRKARLGLLVRHSRISAAVKKALKIGAWSMHLHRRFVSARRVESVHRAGMKVFVYTVNDRTLALLMRKIGVDGIFTNYPDIMKG
ncbi:MAG: glycerophosphodiester phosphodiesterase family protein [bacterium]